MIEFTAKNNAETQEVFSTLTLPLDLRQKSRQRVKLDNGEEAAVLLKRGTVLYNDDLLVSEDDNRCIQVKAARETLSLVECDNPLLLARACYHLGNRHMSIQIEEGRFYYLHDHVLDDMLSGLGLEVKTVSAPFEPEPGAYGGHASNAGHGHHHAH